MKKLALSATLAAVTLMSGCASIFNDKTQTINVTASNAATIKGTVDGMPFTTPGAVNVFRQKNAKIFITEAEGCNPQTVADSNVDVKFFGNILSGGVLGSTTDYSTEKMWKYSENVVIHCTK
jgi:hypothetical protein